MTGIRGEVEAYVLQRYPCQEVPRGALSEMGDRFGVTRERIRQIRRVRAQLHPGRRSFCSLRCLHSGNRH